MAMIEAWFASVDAVMLESPSPEALAAMKATEDAPKIAALASSRERLIGYWGERGEGKEDPTLGQVARQLSAALGK